MTSTRASVPFAQLTVSCAPSSSAASCSNALTSGPKMNRAESSVRAKASWSSGISGAYCALTSTWGIDIGRGDRSRAAAANHPIRHGARDSHYDEDFDVPEVVVQGLPVAAEGPARPGQGDAPDRVPGEGEHVVAGERALEHARGDRDERARDRGDATEEDRPRIPAL